MSKNYFNSNETLENCDVTVSQQGNITVDAKKYNTEAMARLGTPQKVIRGRVKVEQGLLRFDPYDDAARKPTFTAQMCVGSTLIQCTDTKVKFSFSVSRSLSKPLLLLYIQSEIDEVKRRLAEDIYDKLIVNGGAEEEGGEA